MVQVNEEYKSLLESCTELIRSLENNMDFSSDGQKISFEEVFFEDLLKYFLYLACCDGFISNEEAEFVECYTGYYLTPNQIADRVNRENIFSDEFENSIPTSFSAFIDIQNYLNSVSEGFSTTVPDLYITLFKRLGKDITEVDGETQPEEAYGITNYVNNLQTYMNERLEGFSLGPSDEYKKKIGISGGVKAPSKVRTLKYSV